MIPAHPSVRSDASWFGERLHRLRAAARGGDIDHLVTTAAPFQETRSFPLPEAPEMTA